jgi:hypothetical protein
MGRAGEEIITDFSAVFRDFPHRSSPYLRGFTHFYGWDLFFGDWRFLTRIDVVARFPAALILTCRCGIGRV